jgi:hypothetical protein
VFCADVLANVAVFLTASRKGARTRARHHKAA